GLRGEPQWAHLPLGEVGRRIERGSEPEHWAAGPGDRKWQDHPPLCLGCADTLGLPLHLGDAAREEETEVAQALLPPGATQPEGEGESIRVTEAVETLQDAMLQSHSHM
ncbi:mCG1633, partial [Mus musculus]